MHAQSTRKLKLVCLGATTVGLLIAMGGLEGEDAMPAPRLAIVLMGVFGWLVHDLTKHWRH